MRVKHLAAKNNMTKGKATNSATRWVPSAIVQKEVEKARTDGLISSSDSIKFPSIERIPQPPSSYRVIFLSFLSLVENRASVPVRLGLQSRLHNRD
jgi:hypothetical protein